MAKPKSSPSPSSSTISTVAVSPSARLNTAEPSAALRSESVAACDTPEARIVTNKPVLIALHIVDAPDSQTKNGRHRRYFSTGYHSRRHPPIDTVILGCCTCPIHTPRSPASPTPSLQASDTLMSAGPADAHQPKPQHCERGNHTTAAQSRWTGGVVLIRAITLPVGVPVVGVIRARR